MATETDAARDRVLAARAALGERAPRPSKPRPGPLSTSRPRSAAARPGRRRRGRRRRSSRSAARSGVFRAARRAVRASPSRCPKSMLPEEVEKTLRELGDDGDKVRGTLERDFAAYAKQAQQGTRAGCGRSCSLAVARPLAARGASKPRRAGCSAPTSEGFQARLAEVQRRGSHEREAGQARDPPAPATPSAARRARHGRRPRRRSRPSRRQRRPLDSARGRVAEWQTRRP